MAATVTEAASMAAKVEASMAGGDGASAAFDGRGGGGRVKGVCAITLLHSSHRSPRFGRGARAPEAADEPSSDSLNCRG